MRSVAIVVTNSASTLRRWRSLVTIRWSRHSVRIVRTIRSATALAFGARGGAGRLKRAPSVFSPRDKATVRAFPVDCRPRTKPRQWRPGKQRIPERSGQPFPSPSEMLRYQPP